MPTLGVSVLVTVLPFPVEAHPGKLVVNSSMTASTVNSNRFAKKRVDLHKLTTAHQRNTKPPTSHEVGGFAKEGQPEGMPLGNIYDNTTKFYYTLCAANNAVANDLAPVVNAGLNVINVEHHIFKHWTI